MHVHDVVAAVAQLAAERGDRERRHGEVRHGPVHGQPDGAAERDQVVRRRAGIRARAAMARAREAVIRVVRGKQAYVVPLAEQLMGQSLDVTPDPARIRVGVGRDERYAHRARLDTRPRFSCHVGGRKDECGCANQEDRGARVVGERARRRSRRACPTSPPRRRGPPPAAPAARDGARRRRRARAANSPTLSGVVPLLEALPRDVEPPLDDVHQLARRVGGEHRARQVGVAAGDHVDQRRARPPPARARAARPRRRAG